MTKHTIAYFISLDSIHCKKWIKHLSESYSCIIITYQGMASTDADLPGIKIYNLLPKRFPVKNFLSRWLTIYRIGNVLKQNKITILHSMYCYPNSIWANYFKNYKKIITTRGSDVLIDYKNIQVSKHPSFIYLKNQLEKAFHDSKFITSTSHQQKDYLIRQNINPDKITIIRTGIEPEHYSLKPNLNSDTKVFRILSPRSIQKNYNIHNMLLAIRYILDSKPNFTITLDQVLFNINTEYLEFLKKFINENGLESNVKFIQPYSLKSASDIYSSYNLAIMIPQSDGTPVSALEAMLIKKALIISNLPYDNDLINDDFCWFADPNNPKEIARIILEIKNEETNAIQLKLDKAHANVIKNANTKNEMLKVTVLYNSLTL